MQTFFFTNFSIFYNFQYFAYFLFALEITVQRLELKKLVRQFNYSSEHSKRRIERAWSRAAPVKLWTLWSKLSLVLAGEEGALVVLDPGLRFRLRSPPTGWGGPGGGAPGTGGWLAGGTGVGWDCNGRSGTAWYDWDESLAMEASPESVLGSSSSSELKSPDENLEDKLWSWSW